MNSGLVVLLQLLLRRVRKHQGHLNNLLPCLSALLHLLILIGGLCHLVPHQTPQDLAGLLRLLVVTILCLHIWFNLHLLCLHLPLRMGAVITMFPHKPTINELFSSLPVYKLEQ